VAGSEYVRRTAVTIYHPVGTCKMGSEADPTTVVNPRGLVKGLKNLRVLDASIMPTIVRCVPQPGEGRHTARLLADGEGRVQFAGRSARAAATPTRRPS